jgi:hypothetical protein
VTPPTPPRAVRVPDAGIPGSISIMIAVVLTVIAAWLVLAALATVACTLITRGGLREDFCRGYLDLELARFFDATPEDGERPGIPRPRVTAG